MTGDISDTNMNLDNQGHTNIRRDSVIQSSSHYSYNK